MAKRVAAAAVLLALVAAALGQNPTTPVGSSDEAEFREAILFRMPQASLTNATRFVLNHSSIAVPLLREAVEAEVNAGFVNSNFSSTSTFTEMMAYAANSDAVDAIAELCETQEARFSPMVTRILNHAITRKREFEVAAYAAERYPTLRKYVGEWLESNLALPLSAELLAQSVVRHEDAGDRNPADSLLPLITQSQREDFKVTLETVRAVEREKEKHRQ